MNWTPFIIWSVVWSILISLSLKLLGIEATTEIGEYALWNMKILASCFIAYEIGNPFQRSVIRTGKTHAHRQVMNEAESRTGRE